MNKVGGRRFLELATKRVTHASSSKIGPFTTLSKPGARGFLGRNCKNFLEIAAKRVTHASSSKIGPFITLGKPRGFLARIW